MIEPMARPEWTPQKVDMDGSRRASSIEMKPLSIVEWPAQP